MITEEKLLPIFNYIDPNTGKVSIISTNVVKRDGVEIAREATMHSFFPGHIEAVKEFCGVEDSPEIQYLNTVWKNFEPQTEGE